VLLAKEIIGRFHSPRAAEQAEFEFMSRFRFGAIPDDLPEVAIATAGAGIGLAALLKQAQLAPSTSEAIRNIEQGGVKIDGEKVSDKALALSAGQTLVIQVGKRKFARVTLA
jgi:tyrosyl-tRNA synthetase